MQRGIGEERSSQTEARMHDAHAKPTRRTPPRTKLRGGDHMRGGSHVGPGHAGRHALSWYSTLKGIASGVTLAVCMLATAFSCVGITALATSTTGTITAGRAVGQPATAVYCTFEISVGGVSHKAYCAEAPWEGPSSGDTYVLQGETRIDALDYVLYHGYDGQTVKHLSGSDGSTLNETRSRAVTQAAAWMAIGSAYPGNYDDWDGYAEYTEKFKAHDGVGYQTAVNLYNAAKQYDALPDATKAKRPEYRFSTLWSKQGDQGRSSGSHCQMLVMVGSKNGLIRVDKTSAELSLTSGNERYSIKGAKYGVYSDKDCKNLLQTLVTDATGSVTGDSLASGTYWVKELTASQGFLLDPSVYEVEVKPAQTSVISVRETPVHALANISLQKLDKDGDQLGTQEASSPQGAATLEGAEFTVNYYDVQCTDVESLPQSATRSWTFVTNSQGIVRFDQTTPQGDELFKNSEDTIVFPLGTYTISETKAPYGYLLSNETTHLAHVVADNSSATGASWEWGDDWNAVHRNEDVEGRAIADQVMRGGIALIKVDAEGGPQGDASLEGISFGVINRNSNPVRYDGVEYAVDQTIDGLVLVTDSEGKAATARDALPIGTYEVFEMQANDGYLTSEETKTVTITTAGVGKLTYAGEFGDSVVRGGVRVGKVSMQSLMHRPEGAASFEGALLGVRLSGGYPVLVDGVRHREGDTVAKIELDADGFGQTAADALPYGSYELYEIQAPEGELLNTTWTQPFQIREQGVIVDLSSEEQSVPDQVKRGDLKAVKAVESSQERLANIPFVLESVTTGEWHVIVTDENGHASTESAWNAHSHNTNANDTLVTRDEDGGYRLSEIAGSLDSSAGVWFDGYDDVSVEVDDSLGALPYDSYRLIEIGCEANEGLALIDIPFRVYRDAFTINLGTLDNQPEAEPPVIATQLTYDDDHVAPVAENVTLVDTVSYRNLEAGTEYLLSGELHLVSDDGSDGGVVAQAEERFTCSQVAGTTEITFLIDSTQLAGRSVVAFETLYANNTEVAAHADLSDKGQTVTFPSIGTTLTSASGAKSVGSAGMIELIDTVSYTGLEPGRNYTLRGSLVDKASGEKIQVDGQPVVAETVFMPNESTGTAVVTFVFDASQVAGKSVVAFEDLVGYTVHADLEDEDQTVVFPSIGTTARVGEIDEACARQQVTIVDTVNFENLEVGSTYKLVGTLMDAQTGTAVENGGAVISSEATFVPEDPKGETRLELTFDATGYEGHDVVVFERVFSVDGESEELIAIHEDLSDGGQTIHFPSIGTTLNDPVTATHETVQDESVTLTDTVQYRNLTPGKTYTITGELHLKAEDGSDEGPLTDAKGNTVTAEATFVPEERTGETTLSFTVDTRALAGRTIVAFETLEREGITLAVHANIEDEEQSVRVPSIHTTLTDSRSGKQEVTEDEEVVLTDVVEFHNLTPGRSYHLSGSLVYQDNGKPLTANGKPVVASADFTPASTNGKALVSFSVNTKGLGGRSIVAFETLSDGERTVATHADLNDKGQTVRVTEKPLQPLKPASPGTPKTGDLRLPWLLFAFFGLALTALGIAAYGRSHPDAESKRARGVKKPLAMHRAIPSATPRQVSVSPLERVFDEDL